MTSFHFVGFICVVLALFVDHPLPAEAQYAFREEPRDSAVQLGDTATLRCAVDNRKTAIVAWWSDGLGGFISQNHQLKQFSTDTDKLERYSITGELALGEFNLQIRNFSSSDAGTYRCHILASAERETVVKYSRDATLRVAPYDPRCYVESVSPVPMIGDKVALVCESRNFDYSDDLTWMYAARRILKGNITRTPTVRNVVTHVLTEADYDARFMCFEQQRRTCFLIPLRRYISVLVQTAVAQPQLGDTLTYRCVADNDLTPLSYSWRINGVDVAVADDTLTVGPLNASHNGSVIECAVKHSSGFKGNDNITLRIQPNEGGTRTTPLSTTTEDSSSQRSAENVPTDFHRSNVWPTTGPTNPILLDQRDTSKSQEDGWGGLLMPFVICASVVGVLLTTVIILLTVFLNRQRASNRRANSAAKTSDSTGGPVSDCVPLDLVANRDVNVNGSPAISVGTLKGFKNPAGCGSVDTFEIDLDPESPPEYYTLEHNYYEATVGKLDSTNCSDNHDSGFDGIEVSETITPDSELTARNRKFSFGSSPPPHIPSSSSQPSAPVAIPPEFEGSNSECLVAAYAVTDVARSSPPDTKRSNARGGSLKRPLPARPTDSGYRSPGVVLANERPFRRVGSLKSIDEPVVGALARSNSLKRPLPATPRSVSLRTPRTPDPYRNPSPLFTRIPPFLSSDSPGATPAVTSTSETKTDLPKETDKPQKSKVPQKYPKLTVPFERLSAATSVSEGDYAEIDMDQEQEATERDSLMSNSSIMGDNAGSLGDNETRSTVDVEDLAGAEVNGGEADYDTVAESDGEEIDTDHMEKNALAALISDGKQPWSDIGNSDKVEEFQEVHLPDEIPEIPDELICQKSPMYAKVKRQNSQEFPLSDTDINEENHTELDNVNSQLCSVNISPVDGHFEMDINNLGQERALLENAEQPYALVK
ncbi:uncharacterized protein LOC110978882 [Acanthaster planci]|uniref:Uncharacterized protein LOC110978882 n=1 Tax=Acanthaster planci TaxID=133434 RepID=A0A8B7YBZ4_ACAPL|nr:uncharacterized protein LOC110978882 [Acanthaster planci]